MRERGGRIPHREEAYDLPRDEKHIKHACRQERTFCIEWDCNRRYCLLATGRDCNCEAGSKNCIFGGEFHGDR